MSKRLKMTALLAVLMVILMLAIGLVACNPKTNTYKVTTQFNAEQGDVVLAPEAKDGIYDEGTLITVSVTAKSGYEFDALTVNTDENAALNNEGKYIFKVTADTQITVLFRSVAPAACEHKNLSALVAGKAATCMEAGVIAHYHCNDCNKDLAEDKKTILESTVINIDPTAHKYGEMQDLKPATCGATGTKAHKDCELCHKHFNAENVEIPESELEIPATGQHQFDKYESAGKEGHKFVCSVCNTPQSDTVVKHTLKINADKSKFECEQCDYEENHTHDLETESAGESGHKSVCKTEGCGYESGVTNHTLKINADKTAFECEQCDYSVAHSHDTEVRSAGASGHKDVCKTEGCGYESSVTKHTLKINADKSKFECEQCDYEEEHSHDLETESAGESGHKSVCKTVGCGYESGVTNHTLKINADKTAFECEQCDYSVAHSHDTEVRSAGASGHKDVCKTEGCGYESSVTKHTLKINADKSKFECEQCDYEEEHTHDLETESAGESGHKSVCKTEGCGYESGVTPHSGGTLDYDPDDAESGHFYVCECGEHYGKTGHTYGGYISDGSTGHYQQCDCGYATDTVAHTAVREGVGKDEHDKIEYDKDGHWNVCSACEAKMNETTHDLEWNTHNDSGHYKQCKNVRCGFKDTENIEPHVTNYVGAHWQETTSGKVGHCIPCQICGNESATFEQHQAAPDAQWQMTEENHYKVCAKCSAPRCDMALHTNTKGVFDYYKSDEDSHWIGCEVCDWIKAGSKEGHDKSVDPTEHEDSSKYHYLICPQCKKDMGKESHEMTIYVDFDESQHTVKCSASGCEHTTNESHVHAMDGDYYIGDGTCEKCSHDMGIYTFDEDTQSITKYNGQFEKVKLPTQINGKDVLGVGKKGATKASEAFAGSILKEVVFSSTITTIYNRAFCASAITTLNVPDTVTTIEGYAFVQSKSLLEVVISDNTAFADDGNSIFGACTSLKKVTLGKKITSLKNTFGTDSALEYVLFRCESAPTLTSNVFNKVTSLIAVYFSCTKEDIDQAKEEGKIVNSPNSNLYSKGIIKVYYADEQAVPSDLGGYEAWHYNGGDDIEHIDVWAKQ